MNKISISNIDLDITLLWWQSFAWEKIGDWYYWVMQNRIVKVKKDFDSTLNTKWKFLLWQTYDENWIETNDESFIKKYFRLDLDFNYIIKKISKDRFIKSAIKTYPWLRILSQDFKQCMLSFVLSSNNSIPNIRNSIRLMSKVLWKKVILDWIDFNLFPMESVISEQTEEQLRWFKMGFRARYLLECAKMLNIKNIKQWNNENDIRIFLKSIIWIWDKIADCIMCFSLWFDNITPIDTWAKKVLLKLYKLDEKMTIDDIRNWINEYFEMFWNFAWHFLFEYVRNNSKVLNDVE